MINILMHKAIFLLAAFSLAMPMFGDTINIAFTSEFNDDIGLDSGSIKLLQSKSGYYYKSYAGLSSTYSAASKDGYRFSGWYTLMDDIDSAPPVSPSVCTNGPVETETTISSDTISKECKCAGSLTKYYVLCPKYVKVHTISVSASPANAGTASGGGTYDEGAEVTLSVVVSNGYEVCYWQKDGGKIDGSEKKNSIKIVVDDDFAYTAVLKGKEFNLCVHPQGGTYKGSAADYDFSNEGKKLCFGETTLNDIGVATRTGYSLKGYYLSSTGGKMVYDENGHNKQCEDWWTADYSDGKFCGLEKLDVWAYWEANNYTVSFDKQGGTGGTDSIGVTTDKTLPQVTPPTKVGYKFGGYFTEPGGKGTQYWDKDGKGSGTISSGLTLYAKWDPEKYTVTFDNDGAKSGLASVEVEYATVPNPLSIIPDKDDNSFDGYWYEEKMLWDKNGHWWSKDEKWDIPSNITAKALWNPTKYIVKFDANGGEGSYVDLSKSKDEEFTLPDGTSLTNKNYAFGGWALSDKAATAKYKGGSTTTIQADIGSLVGGVITYFAYWRDLKRIVHFHADARAILSTNELQVIAGKPYGELPTVSWPGDRYGFDGWWTAEVGGELVTKDSMVPEDESIDLHAHWVTNSYFIAFDGCGAESGQMEVQEFKFDTPQCLHLNAYQKTGYAFQGWTTNNSAEVVLADGAEVTNLLASCKNETNTVYAVWKANEYTVAFDPKYPDSKGGEWSGPSEVTKTYDVEWQIPSEEPVSSNKLYQFTGWQDELTKKIYESGSWVSNLTAEADGNVTLQAQWKFDVGPYSEALGCDNLRFDAWDDTHWQVAGGGEPEGSPVSMSVRHSGNTTDRLSASPETTGVLRFKWFSKYDGVRLSLNDSLEFEATVGMGWAEVSVPIQEGKIEFAVKNAKTDDLIWIANLTWTPGEAPHPVPGPGDEAVIYGATVQDGRFVMAFSNQQQFAYEILTNSNIAVTNGWALKDVTNSVDEIIIFSPEIDPAVPTMFYKVKTIQRP